jgi:flagellar biosynthetic protein FliR
MDLATLISQSINLPRFLLVLARVAGVFSIAPVLGNTNVPIRFRVGLAAFVAMFLVPVVTAPALPDVFALASAVVSEVAVGLLIGMISQMIFYAVQFAGHMVATQMGFGVERLIDPNSHTQVTAIGQLYLFAAMLTFLAVDGHHLLLMALARSFQTVPLGGFTIGPVVVGRFIEITSSLFVVAFIFMLPLLGILLLIEISLAIAARVMPQMNAFVAGFPIKILVGSIALMLSLPLICSTFETWVAKSASMILRFFS